MVKCDIIEKGKEKDIIFLHGFLGNSNLYKKSKKYYDDLDYNLIYCNAKGYYLKNQDMNELCNWKGTMDDINDLINRRNNETVLIGNSMGGAIFLRLSDINKNVNKVFAISSPYELNSSKEINKRIKACDDFSNITSALPESIKKVKRNPKRYLIHEIDDQIVNISHFHENKNKFNIPSKNTLVLDILFPFFSHNTPVYNKKTHNFIKRNILLNDDE